ncbi:hypothetical protein Tco_0308377 [Tanacetum coccineum]
MDNTVYLVEHCTRKDAPIRSPTGIGAGLGEHLAPMKRSNKIPIGDRGGFGEWFANRVWGWKVAAPLQTSPIAIPIPIEATKELPIIVGYMLFCIETHTPFNIAYFLAKRMDGMEFNKDPISFSRIITTLVEFIKNDYPEDDSRVIWQSEHVSSSFGKLWAENINPDDATIYDLPDDDALHALWIVTISGCLKSSELKIQKIFAPSLTNNRRKTVLPLGIVTISGCLKSYELKILKIFAPSLTNNRRKVIIEISGDTGEKKVTEENRVLQAP